MPRKASLDLLRSFAIIWVFLFHYFHAAEAQWLRPIGQFGWAGVDLFFVLSGFLIGSQLLKPLTQGKSPSLAEFYLRRMFRILPCYWTVLTLYFLLPGFAERNGIPPLWKFLTFTQNLGLDRSSQGAFSHAWSLCVEEHFYVVLPWLILLFRKYGTPTRVVAFMMGIFTFGIAIRAGIWFHFIAPIMAATPQKGYWSFFARLLYYPTYARLDGLMIGVAIALVYRLRPTLWRRLKAYGNSALVTGIFTLALGLLLAKDKENSWIGATFAYPLVSLGFGAMVFSALAEGSFISRIRVPGAQACATLAFSFYLIHKEMIHWVLDHATGWGLNPTGIWTFLLSAGVSVLASITLYSLVEYPFLLLRDYYVINSADSRARGTHAEKEAKAYG